MAAQEFDTPAENGSRPVIWHHCQTLCEMLLGALPIAGATGPNPVGEEAAQLLLRGYPDLVFRLVQNIHPKSGSYVAWSSTKQ